MARKQVKRTRKSSVKRATKAAKNVIKLKKVVKVSPQFRKELAEETKAVKAEVRELRAHKEKNKKVFSMIKVCKDCGTERRVMPQDSFHVTRCELHQIKAKREKATARMQEYRLKLAKGRKKRAA